MKKKKNKKPAGNPISRKIIAGLKKTSARKVIDISEIKERKSHAEDLEKTVVTEEELAEYDPLHAVYIFAQNKMSILMEQLGELPPLSKLANAYADAMDLYMPSGPPISPLTKSYFTCWGLFDLSVGIKKESFGTVIIDVCRYLGVHTNLITVFECMQNSRMGLYVHEGFSGNFILLRELITETEVTAIAPSGYVGHPGEILLARIMPNPFPELNYGYAIVFTTPYILAEMRNDRFVPASEEKWLLYFERSQEKTKIKDKIRSYEALMKYGLSRHYWNEYIFEAYVNNKKELIFLAGFPDDPSSRPHSDVNNE
jgi:hypothetical protein